MLEKEEGVAGANSVPAVRVGVVILPEFRWADAQPVWRRAEELGFDHAWTWRSYRTVTS